MEATGMKKFQIPTTNIQTISKFQVSNPVSRVLGHWSFSGIWMLEFGISYQEDCIDVSQISKL
jgi:hypothetical protein